ncbi:AtpZ/AtpI family protein [Paracoccus siganidrum]|uniref:ATP synthase protein I n=1 Tax=Paracoccus siganidrum TaxID=1276757 RepID=A0A419AAJ4_9RHOB|nr:AtpZ/AtpI family protein [Paracoccus siganidrum]RJL20095.1 AtpZ/AtpI family protein [Paracoccus siganidrum]RMC32522.1 F0F1 ATP synthase subunit I [Paracoccus siganidrum]
MAEGPRNDADREADAARLRDLEQRLAQMTPKQSARGPMADYDKAHLAWRMVIELVAGLGIGLVIGYGLDHLFGTAPLMMVVFIFLGFAAGIKTMMRTAAELARTGGTPDGNASGKAPDMDERD